MRDRSCNKPYPAYNGELCQGDGSQTQNCQAIPIPDNQFSKSTFLVEETYRETRFVPLALKSTKSCNFGWYPQPTSGWYYHEKWAKLKFKQLCEKCIFSKTYTGGSYLSCIKVLTSLAFKLAFKFNFSLLKYFVATNLISFYFDVCCMTHPKSLKIPHKLIISWAVPSG